MRKIDRLHPDIAVEKLLELDFVEPKIEEINIFDGNKRIVAEDIYAKDPVPGFDKSPYDGYAFRYQDTKGATKESPIKLEIIEEIPAGYNPQMEIKAGQAAKILTGGPVPPGANVCIKKEKTEYTEDFVKIFSQFDGEKDIIHAGEDTNVGDLIIKKGTELNPGFLGQLTSQGLEKIKVFKKLKVGILNMGDELVTVGNKLSPAKIYETNTISIGSILDNLGFDVIHLGIVDDEPKIIEKKIKESLNQVDILMTTGGASVGDYDYALTSVENIGGEIVFWKSTMRPGGSIVFSLYKDKPIVGLSGNPAAAILSLFRVCLPYLYRAQGKEKIFVPKIDMILRDGFNKKSPGVRLLRGRLKYKDGKVYFVESSSQGMGVLSSFTKTDALCEIPQGSDEIPAGTVLQGYQVADIYGV